MKKVHLSYTTIILICLFLLLSRNAEVKELNRSIYAAEINLVNFYNNHHIEFLFTQVTESPSKESIEALTSGLAQQRKVVEAIINLNRTKITKEVWSEYEKLPLEADDQSIAYFLNLAEKGELAESEYKKIELVKNSWISFGQSVSNDMYPLSGVNNPTSLLASYITLIKELDEVLVQ